MREPEFSPRAVIEALGRLPAAGRYWVAFSGGLDSSVLLDALGEVRQRLPGELHAVHVDHGLQRDSGRWVAHCRERCARLGLPCTVVAVAAAAGPGESPEAAARRARYAAFTRLLGPGEALLTGHHQDDQAETLLLRLLRGSGPRGLAGMAEHRGLGAGWLGRPLLGWPRAALRAWALARGLAWLEDPSNGDTRFDRNFLRAEVLPVLERRWPGLSRRLVRAAVHQREAQALLDRLAPAELAAARGEGAGTLSVRALRALPGPRRRLVLRAWLGELGLPAPSAAGLERIAREVLHARPDASPRVAWPGAEVRRYRDALCAGVAEARPVEEGPWPWRPPAPLGLPGGVLAVEPAVSAGLSRGALQGRALSVRLRRGGERCRLPGCAGRHAMKKLLQAEGVPPWERERLPLVYVDEELAAVADLWVCEPFACPSGEPGWRLRWRPAGGVRLEGAAVLGGE